MLVTYSVNPFQVHTDLL